MREVRRITTAGTRLPDRGEIPSWTDREARAIYDAETSRLSAAWRLAHDAWEKECHRIGLEVNHIEPRHGRGYGNGCWNHLANLETLCRACHVSVTKEQRAARVAGASAVWWVYTAFRIMRSTGNHWNAWTYRGAVRAGDLLHATIEQAVIDSRLHPLVEDPAKPYVEEWWFAPIRLYTSDVDDTASGAYSLVKRKVPLKPFAPLREWPPQLLEI